MLSHWFEPEDFEALVSALRDDLASAKMSPEAAVKPLWRQARSPRELLALLDVIEPYKTQLSPGGYGQIAVLRAVGLVDSGRYRDGLGVAGQAIEDQLVPAGRHAELFNVKGRCLFHLHDFKAATAAYRAGIRATGPDDPFLAQLYTNLGNAMLGDGEWQNYEADIPGAIAVLEHAVARANSPRLEVEARCSLSTALINGNMFGRATELLEEAWRIADGNHEVQDKARVMVLRNLAVAQILTGETNRGVETMERSITMALGFYGPCHPEMINHYRYIFGCYLMGILSSQAMIERVLRVFQSAQMVCGLGSEGVAAYTGMVIDMLRAVARREGVEERWSEANALLMLYVNRVIDEPGIKAVTEVILGAEGKGAGG